ncbi:SlyX family protein [Geobacter sp. FeAm09]|uniref:SlyX family protein n=1 Tax=Geobacter sp. FeAm09 TaxID=2597769 RepID=UPI001F0EECB8|nr:SlyX family protein [Geobacter sp. FeAm09]
MTSEETMKERIIELELRFMQQEHTIQELNDTVCRQELTIERLVREQSLIREQLRLLAPSINRSDEEEEPPPHY